MKSKANEPKFATRIAKGLEQAIQFMRGEISLRVWEYEDPPPPVKPAAIVALRRKRNMSQEDLARFLKVSAKTVQSWEQGSRKPARASLMALQILGGKPKMMRHSAVLGNGRKKKPA